MAAKKVTKKAAAKKVTKKVAKKVTKKVAKKVTKKAAAKKVTKKVAKKAAAKKVAKKAPAKKVAKKAAAKKASAKKVTKKASAKRAPVRATPREELHMVTELPATPGEILAAWMDSAAHTAFTGAEAFIEPRVGGRHTAWSGYIEGALRVIESDRLVMSWRTSEFDTSDPDSEVEIRVWPSGRGARIEVLHTDLPVGGAEKYAAGWRDFYFIPMAAYFAR